MFVFVLYSKNLSKCLNRGNLAELLQLRFCAENCNFGSQLLVRQQSSSRRFVSQALLTLTWSVSCRLLKPGFIETFMHVGRSRRRRPIPRPFVVVVAFPRCSREIVGEPASPVDGYRGNADGLRELGPVTLD